MDWLGGSERVAGWRDVVELADRLRRWSLQMQEEPKRADLKIGRYRRRGEPRNPEPRIAD
jgi:hypothetical protein